jgi:hypothetical protein
MRPRPSSSIWAVAWLLALAVGVGAPGAAHSQSAPTKWEETPEQFPDFLHREETFYFCSACHNFALSGRQGMSEARWDSTLTWMTERHGMPNLTGDDRQRILSYLTQAFPERAAPGWRNPFQ